MALCKVYQALKKFVFHHHRYHHRYHHHTLLYVNFLSHPSLTPNATKKVEVASMLKLLSECYRSSNFTHYFTFYNVRIYNSDCGGSFGGRGIEWVPMWRKKLCEVHRWVVTPQFVSTLLVAHAGRHVCSPTSIYGSIVFSLLPQFLPHINWHVLGNSLEAQSCELTHASLKAHVWCTSHGVRWLREIAPCSCLSHSRNFTCLVIIPHTFSPKIMSIGFDLGTVSQ